MNVRGRCGCLTYWQQGAVNIPFVCFLTRELSLWSNALSLHVFSSIPVPYPSSCGSAGESDLPYWRSLGPDTPGTFESDDNCRHWGVVKRPQIG